jgi:hypothetical protein
MRGFGSGLGRLKRRGKAMTWGTKSGARKTPAPKSRKWATGRDAGWRDIKLPKTKQPKTSR